jgi:hypothetical protein
LGCAAPTELAGAEQSLQALRAQVQADPLGAASDLDAQIQPLIARIDAELTAQERLRQQLIDGLAAARTQMDALTKMHGDNVVACTQAREGFADFAPAAPQTDEMINGLREWLERLEKKHADGMFEPVAIGLRNWNSAAQDCVTKERASYTANRAPIDARSELRGRMDALQAKARARGAAENDALVELARQAEQLLYTKPTDLDRAAAAVICYEKALNRPR